nr:putative reverse transcriptase domain-containing protein [Tanacetum cinerariifolium]
MPPMMTAQSVGRPAAASRGGGTGGRAGSGGGRTGSRSGDQGNGRNDGQAGQVGGQGSEVNDGVDGVPDFSTIIAHQLQNLLLTIVAQVGDQGKGQGNGRNQNVDAINDNIQGDVRNVIENNDHRGCTYKEFLACNPTEYDGKGCVVVYTCWIEKMESVQDMSGYEDKQQVKYIAGSFVDKALTWWNSHIRTLGREVVVGMSWDNFKLLMRGEFCPSNEMQKLETELWNHTMVGVGHTAYTDRFHELARLVPHLVTLENRRIERNGSIKKNHKKRGNKGEPCKDRNGRDDNKRTRIGNAFATTANSVRREYKGTTPKVMLRNVTPTNARNPTAMAYYECGSTDHIKAACLRRAFMLGAEEARQDLNIMMGAFTLNNHYATTLFDSGADYSFFSTTVIHLLSIEPSDLGFSYEIEIASGQLVKIDYVIKGCKLEIEGHAFDINLIPFGSGSFDMIIGIDWLSNHKAKIICHEKVVRIPLPNGKVLRVIGERPEEKMRHLRSTKTKEQKQEEIVVVRDYPKVFMDDQLGLPLIQEIKFQIEFVPGSIPVTKSAYRLAPSEMEELSYQLKELQDKVYSKTWEEHEVILGLVLELLKKEKLYAKFSKCDFWLREVQFLGHVINGDGIHVDPSKIEAVKNWKSPRTLSEGKLYDAPVLALPDGPEDFVVYCDVSGLGLGCVDAKRILAAQKEACDESAGLQKGLDEMIKHMSDGALYYLDRIWVPLKGDVRTLIMDEAHKSKYYVHLGADMMYYDLRDRYWWPEMKKDIVVYLSRCLACLKVNAEHQRLYGLLQQPEIPKWKWEGIAMDFFIKLPRTSSGHDTIWVIVDRLTKSAHFRPMREDYRMDRLARLYLNKIVARHGVPISIISDRDSQFTLRCWQSVQEALGTRLDMSTTYHPQTNSQKVGEGQLIGPELVQETTEKISQIKDILKATRDCQKSFADKRRKLLEFCICDFVLLKASSWKGVVRYGKKGKLAPRFVGPFEFVENVGLVAYRLRLLEEMNEVHDTFHVLNLNKCLADPTLQVPLDEIQVDAKLNFMEEPVEILEREFKKLK